MLCILLASEVLLRKPTCLFFVVIKLQSKTSGIQGFPGGAMVENLPANAGDTGSSPGLGGSHMPWSN